MKIDTNSELLVKRGISAEVAEAQGFEMWSEDDFGQVIDRGYVDLVETQPGSVQWLKDKAREAGTGLVIKRHSPFVVGEDDDVRPLVPEIRPDQAVSAGSTKRHYHGGPVVMNGVRLDPFVFLPSVVVRATCRRDPGFRESYTLKFSHQHDSLSVEELEEHRLVWHSGITPVKGDKVHYHTLSVFSERAMVKHVQQGADGEKGKKTNPHKGLNSTVIHDHTPMAKYLFAPSEKVDVDWTEEDHHHTRMDEQQLEWHLNTYHPS